MGFVCYDAIILLLSVILSYLGLADLPKMYSGCTSNDLGAYFVRECEQALIMANERLSDKDWAVTQFITLWDLKGIPFTAMMTSGCKYFVCTWIDIKL